MSAPLKISFCTTCMNRLGHLRETLPANVAAADGRGPVEFVVLDYNSTDGLAEWAADALQPHAMPGPVRYFRTGRPDRFHMSHAKNVAHLLATGDVVCNLDADNFLTGGFIDLLRHLFERDPGVVCVAPRHRTGPAAGRIALRRERWRALGGYNEEFGGYGGEDDDMIVRAVAAGLTPVWSNERHWQFIPHGDDDRVRHFGPEFADKHASQARNARTGQADVAAGRLVANAGRRWGVEPVEGPDGPVEVGAGPDDAGGWVTAAVDALGTAERRLYDRVAAQTWFTYARVGDGSRPVELRPDFRVGAGRGGLERHWAVGRRADGSPCVRLTGPAGAICELAPTPDGFRGDWTQFERLPVTLTPLGTPPAEPVTIDLPPMTAPTV